MPVVLVPWRPSAEREAAWSWVSARYAERHPGWRVERCEAPDGAWCKAAALAPAIARCRSSIVVVADADVWCEEIPAAVAAVERGVAWAMPHRRVRRLTSTATTAVFTGADPWDQDDDQLEQVPYTGTFGGGILVLPLQTLRAVPPDPRFQGWGQEDQSWAIALSCLAGRPWRGTAPLVHLWHPPQERMSRTKGCEAGWNLRLRYGRARRDPERMRALLAEVGS